ncbi:hypothetical protein C1H46_000887 [Malus baccata]|uniref:Uncharacterized protein n=1 Tax=Malus baccata TaxID=106549 RepID=A0A540NR84_MALBA|nr:hypothetical protein C1H46_000887 [Malus baccata]
MAAMGALCLRVGLNSKPPNSNPPKLDKLDTFGQLRAVKEARKSRATGSDGRVRWWLMSEIGSAWLEKSVRKWRSNTTNLIKFTR